jgi:hypothetical protein
VNRKNSNGDCVHSATLGLLYFAKLITIIGATFPAKQRLLCTEIPYCPKNRSDVNGGSCNGSRLIVVA